MVDSKLATGGFPKSGELLFHSDNRQDYFGIIKGKKSTDDLVIAIEKAMKKGLK